MTQEALKYLKTITEAFGPDAGIELDQKAWAKLHTAIKEALAQTAQEPVAHSVIAGVLFDFMGWLTSRKERIVLSSADNASPAADAIRDFANMRGLSLDDAKVLDWNTTPPQRTWVGLEGQEIRNLWEEATKPDRSTMTMVTSFAKSIEAKLKQKNGYAEEKT